MTETLQLQQDPTRLLLVEDDPLCLATLHSGLEDLGYEPIRAASGQEAIDICRSSDVDLAILDVELPDMCGLELGRLLYETQNIPVIYLTGHNDCAFLDRATSEGAFAYLLKPLEAARIAPVVETALAKAEELGEMALQQRHLQRALDQDRNISMCVGVLMQRHHLPHRQAYALLRHHARSQRRKLSEVASAFIQAMDELNQLSPLPEPVHDKVGRRRSNTA